MCERILTIFFFSTKSINLFFKKDTLYFCSKQVPSTANVGMLLFRDY